MAVLHPAAQLVLDDMSGRRSEVVESMPRLAVILSDGRTWTDLRTGFAAGTWEVPAIPADVAEWMDDGMLSRWLLDGLPSCAESLVVLSDLLSERLLTRIRDTLDEWHVSARADADPWLQTRPEESQP